MRTRRPRSHTFLLRISRGDDEIANSLPRSRFGYLFFPPRPAVPVCRWFILAWSEKKNSIFVFFFFYSD